MLHIRFQQHLFRAFFFSQIMLCAMYYDTIYYHFPINSQYLKTCGVDGPAGAFQIISSFLKLVDRQGNFLWLSLHSWQFYWSSEGEFICGKSKGRPVSLAAVFGERHCMTRQKLLWGRLKEGTRRKNGLSSEGLTAPTKQLAMLR